MSDRGYGLPTVPATLRKATPADAAPIARLVIETELAYLEHLLPDEHVWVLLAEEDGRLVGQVSILPSVRHVHPEPDPSLAHFRNLFVAQDHWGTGLATTLHAASIEEARDRGFEQMRLFTPAEVSYCERHKNKFERYAARFAAKEAAMKALGTGWSHGVRWRDIEVTREATGKPTLHLAGAALQIADRLGVKNISVSITHSGNLALAQVIFES